MYHSKFYAMAEQKPERRPATSFQGFSSCNLQAIADINLEKRLSIVLKVKQQR
jgi:hypothetical protein